MTNGELETFYDHSRPRKLLALDGGGIRGALTLEVLVKIESMLAKATGRGDSFRLCHFFDYIGGTSTGARPCQTYPGRLACRTATLLSPPCRALELLQ